MINRGQNAQGEMPIQVSALTSCFFESYLTSKAITPDCEPSQSLPFGIYLHAQVSLLDTTLGFWTPFPWPPMATSLTKGWQDDYGLIFLKQVWKEPPVCSQRTEF